MSSKSQKRNRDQNSYRFNFGTSSLFSWEFAGDLDRAGEAHRLYTFCNTARVGRTLNDIIHIDRFGLNDQSTVLLLIVGVGGFGSF